MLLVIDVGNTNIVLGVYDKKKFSRTLENFYRSCAYHGRIWHVDDEICFFHDRKVNAKDIKAIIISSVVPPLMPTLERVCLRYFNVNPIIVGPGTKNRYRY